MLFDPIFFSYDTTGSILSTSIGDVASSKRPRSSSRKCNCAYARMPTTFLFYPQKLATVFAGKNLVTAQTQLHLYSKKQRAFGIGNVEYLQIIRTRRQRRCNFVTTPPRELYPKVLDR